MKTLIFDLDGTLVRLKPDLVCFADLKRLSMLRQKYRFALVSGSPKEEITWALSQTGLDALFDNDLIVSFEDTNSEKATGKPFQEMKRRIEGTAVMVGDSQSDETGSAIAGLPFVRVKNCATVAEQQQVLDAAITRAVDLIEQKPQTT